MSCEPIPTRGQTPLNTRPDPTLVLLHGLGANSGVWTGLKDALDWPGPVVCPDLAGHGSAPWTGTYTVEAIAAGVADQISRVERVFILGHSLGAAVGIELASGTYGPAVDGVIGLGIKTTWTDDDVAGMTKVAERGIRWFDERDGAVDRFLRQSGLVGLVADDHPAVIAGVIEASPDDGATTRWRTTQDPQSFAQKPVDLVDLLGATTVPVTLGAGEGDEMATEAELRAYTDRVAIAPGSGHNVIVEDPAWVLSLMTTVFGDITAEGRR